MQYFYFVISVLAAWRVTHLLSKEDGPFNIIYHTRKKLGEGFWGSLLDCFYCLSIWISLPFGIWIGIGVIEKIVIWPAISGAACLLEKMTEKKEPVQYYEEEDKV